MSLGDHQTFCMLSTGSPVPKELNISSSSLSRDFMEGSVQFAAVWQNKLMGSQPMSSFCTISRGKVGILGGPAFHEPGRDPDDLWGGSGRDPAAQIGLMRHLRFSSQARHGLCRAPVAGSVQRPSQARVSSTKGWNLVC